MSGRWGREERQEGGKGTIKLQVLWIVSTISKDITGAPEQIWQQYSKQKCNVNCYLVLLLFSHS